VRAGIRKLDLSAHSGTRDAEKPGKWKSLANAEVETPTTDTTLASAWILRISAGRGGLADPPFVGVDGGLEISQKRCKATRARVPLTTRGLAGGAAGPFSDDYECFPARTLLVRVRGAFDKPTRLERNRRGYLEAAGTPRQIEFALRTRVGRPFAYGSVSDSGRARLFVVGTCTRD
jgi:hypothetical protein